MKIVAYINTDASKVNAIPARTELINRIAILISVDRFVWCDCLSWSLTLELSGGGAVRLDDLLASGYEELADTLRITMIYCMIF